MTVSSTTVSLAILVYVSAGFVLSAVWRRNDIADVMWGPGILLAAVTGLLSSGQSWTSGPLAYLICMFIIVWAARILG